MEKKRLVISYKNLSDDLKEELAAQYPGGYGENLLKINKPDNGFFYAVPFETEDTKYLVKIDVKVDLNHEDEEEEAYPDESIVPDAPEDLGNEEDDFDEEEDDGYDEEIVDNEMGDEEDDEM